RAGLLAGLTYPDKDVDRADARRQRTVLLLAVGGPSPRAHPGAGHDLRRTARVAARDGVGEGRGRARDGRGPGVGVLPGLGAAAAPARDGAARRRRGIVARSG